MQKKTIKKAYRLQDILISFGILFLGLIFTIAVPSWNWLGISLLITAAFMVPFYKTGYVIKSQKGVFLKKEILLPHECKDQIADYIEGRSEKLEINPFYKGGLLLEWYFKKDKSKHFGQLFDYDEGIYTPKCKLSEMSGEQINELLKHQS